MQQPENSRGRRASGYSWQRCAPRGEPSVFWISVSAPMRGQLPATPQRQSPRNSRFRKSRRKHAEAVITGARAGAPLSRMQYTHEAPGGTRRDGPGGAVAQEPRRCGRTAVPLIWRGLCSGRGAAAGSFIFCPYPLQGKALLPFLTFRFFEILGALTRL